MKRWWRLRTIDNLWSQFVKAKYCPISNMVSKVISPNNSNIWRSLLKIRLQAEQHIKWEINKGKVLFWWDNWPDQGPVAPRVWLERKLGSITVQNFINNNNLNMNSLERVITNDLIQGVMDTEIGERQLPDKSIWTPTTNGNFTCSSAWQIVRQKQDVDLLAKMIWAKGTPFKISFFMWRLLRKKLPLDDRILSLGIQTDSNCNCCREQLPEKVDHVFTTSLFAMRIWNQMATPLGISHQGNSVQGALDCWWRVQPNNQVHKHILLITPCYILWQLWRARCDKRLLFLKDSTK
ncbi:uncharacterized protein LOC132061510 [Lycium ferocissimum]|uniref:uncharacterized protein LOC132061510 n=1 Tax=Lycium ferocissimum TaxID=112874 RepID=UPI002814E2E2|nr:uncharacterized protein LOC132061510 [Lycium ferocissimum]